MNKKGFSLVEVMIAAGMMAVLIIGGFLFFSSNEDGETPENISNQSYVGNSAEECSRIQVMCVEGFERFDDENGCGCKEVEKVENIAKDVKKIIEDGNEEIDVSDWETYTNPTHNFSFLSPLSDNWRIDEAGEMGTENGRFGNYVVSLTPSVHHIFSIDVMYTPDWTILGNANGDVDALEEGYRTGGVKEVARLSREVNLQKEKNAPDKQTGELEEYHFKNGVGYGFMVTDTFSFCFNVNYECGSGKTVEDLSTIVYVEKDEKIYRIEFLSNTIGDTIFESLEI